MADESRKWRRSIVRMWLEHVNAVAVALDDHKRRLADVRSIAEPRGIDYSAVRVSTSPSADAMPNAVASIEELEARYVTDIVGFEDELRDARARLTCLDVTQRKVICEHYFRGNEFRPPMEAVARRIGYSRDWCARVELEACDRLFAHLPDDWRVAIPSAI